MRLDSVMGWVESESRWYSPTLGSWTSVDPLGFGGGDVREYGFEGNGAVDGLDWSGEEDYRKKFIDATPEMPLVWQVHHTKQQALLERYAAAGVNVNDVSLLRGVPRSIHSEITQSQLKWAQDQMRELKILADGETLTKDNSAVKFKQLWAQVDLDKAKKFEDELEKVYGKYWLKSGKNQWTEIRKIQKYSDGDKAKARFTLGKGERLQKLFPAAAGALAFFALFGTAADAIAAAEGFNEAQQGAWDHFERLHNGLIENALNGREATSAELHHLRNAVIEFAKTLGLDSDALKYLDASMGAYIDARGH